MINKLYRFLENKDTGFSSKAEYQTTRLINKDGSFNVRKIGIPFWKKFSLFHSLISMTWIQFFFSVFLIFLLINSMYASLYMIVGMEHLAGTLHRTFSEGCWEAFFFSVQTFTTVGYGRVNPVGIWAGIIASLEALNGLLAIAIMSGLLYGRFSKPRAKILYSKNAIIGKYQEGRAIMFRLANVGYSLLSDLSIKVILSVLDENEEGNKIRKFYNLELERDRVTMLPTSWTVVHPLNDQSPLAPFTAEELKERKAEILIHFKAYDELFSQEVTSRHSYEYEEWKWDVSFENIFHDSPNGKLILDLSKIGDLRKKYSL